MQTGYDQLGEVFTVPVAHKRVTFLIGPDVAPHFFKGTDDEMSQTEVSGWPSVTPSCHWQQPRRRGSRGCLHTSLQQGNAQCPRCR